MTLFFVGLLGLGTLALWRSWKLQTKGHLPFLLAGWAGIIAGVIGWTMHFRDSGTAFAVVSVCLVALAVVFFTAYRAWSASKEKPAPRRVRPRDAADAKAQNAVLGVAKTAGAILLAGPIAGALAIVLCISLGRVAEASGWSEADKLGLIYFGVPVVWSVITAYVLLARSWRRRLAVTAGLVTVGAISLATSA